MHEHMQTYAYAHMHRHMHMLKHMQQDMFDTTNGAFFEEFSKYSTKLRLQKIQRKRCTLHSIRKKKPRMNSADYIINQPQYAMGFCIFAYDVLQYCCSVVCGLNGTLASCCIINIMYVICGALLLTRIGWP